MATPPARSMPYRGRLCPFNYARMYSCYLGQRIVVFCKGTSSVALSELSRTGLVLANRCFHSMGVALRPILIAPFLNQISKLGLRLFPPSPNFASGSVAGENSSPVVLIQLVVLLHLMLA